MSNSGRSFDSARRGFLLKTGAGLGWAALAELWDDLLLAQQPAADGFAAERRARRTPAFRGEGQARHLPAHARRDVAGRHVRLQADAREDARRRSCQSRSAEPAALDDGRRTDVVPNRRTCRQVQALRPERLMVSDLMQNIGKIADDIAVIKTMYTEHVNHDPASKFLHTGFQIAGRPSLGAWVSYALGSENKDLPMFVVMSEGVRPGRADRRVDLVCRIHPVAPPRRAVPVRGNTGHLHQQSAWPYAEGPSRHARRDRVGGATRSHDSRTIRRFRRRSASTRCRTECSSRCPRLPTSPTSRNMSSTCTGMM